MSEKLQTQKDFERRTGKSRTWQWAARKSGILGYYQINSRIFYSEKQIQDFLEKCEVASQSEEMSSEAIIRKGELG